MHSEYAELANMACVILSFISQGVGVQATFALWRDVIRWRQSKPICNTLREMVKVRQFVQCNHAILVGNDPELNLTSADNIMEMKREAEQKMFH
jgi:hypothetical protein